MRCAMGFRYRISIHALREEGDRLLLLGLFGLLLFLSTPSVRRATLVDDLRLFIGVISIHALREEGDQTRLSIPNPGRDFYPRPP